MRAGFRGPDAAAAARHAQAGRWLVDVMERVQSGTIRTVHLSATKSDFSHERVNMTLEEVTSGCPLLQWMMNVSMAETDARARAGAEGALQQLAAAYAHVWQQSLGDFWPRQ
jgi:hypothetical protein